MSGHLKISLGQYSDKGRKESNQDFHGACIPEEPQLSGKGIAIALADGISSSNVSQVASQSAVRVFLEDYYCTSPAWSVKKSAQQVLMAINSWLYAQTQQSPYRYEKDRGYVCTMSALVLKSTTAHLFHAGDARIYRLRDGVLEQLTHDHRVHGLERAELSQPRARHPVAPGHRLPVAAPGTGRRLSCSPPTACMNSRTLASMINAVKDHAGDLDAAAQLIAREAFDRGSEDNLTTLVVRVDALPTQDANEVHRQLTELPFPPELVPRMNFDGFTILRELHVEQPQPRLPRELRGIAGASGHQDAVDGTARRRGAARKIPHGRLGGAAHQQSPRAESGRARSPPQFSLHRNRIRRWPDAAPMAHRQPEAAGRNGTSG